MPDLFSLSFSDFQFHIELQPDLVRWQLDRNIRVGKKEHKLLNKGELALFNITISTQIGDEPYQFMLTHALLPNKQSLRQKECETLLKQSTIPQIIAHINAIRNHRLCPWIPEEFAKAQKT